MDLTSELGATYYGFIGSTYDALILFEACIAGQIKLISRRPQEREREHVIKSGRVFIYEENISGIKRWTDGIPWSPSRILGNFLIYRQLLKAFGPSEKKRAIKKPKTGLHGIIKPALRDNDSGSRQNQFQNSNGVLSSGGNYGRTNVKQSEKERALFGSLTDSYEFMEEGLIKKTISVSYEARIHHLVSYYTVSDIIDQKLIVPSTDARLAGIKPRTSLMTSQNFRNIVEYFNPMDHTIYSRSMCEMNRHASLLSQTAIMPGFDANKCNNNGTKLDKTYAISHIVSTTSSAAEYGSSACNIRIKHRPSQASTHNTSSTLQKSEKYHKGENHKFDILVAPRVDCNRAPMRTAKAIDKEATILYQRDPWCLTEFSITEETESDPIFCDDQRIFHRNPCEVVSMTGSIAGQANLPGSTKADFDLNRAHGQRQHFATPSNEIKVWRVGNASVGHGHYQNL